MSGCDVCAKVGLPLLRVCDGCSDVDRAKARAEGAAQEREANVKLADDYLHSLGVGLGGQPSPELHIACGQATAARELRDAIRARGEAPKCATCEGRQTVTSHPSIPFSPVPCPDCAPKPARRDDCAVCQDGGRCPLHPLKPDTRELALNALREVEPGGLMSPGVLAAVRAAIRALEGTSGKPPG